MMKLDLSPGHLTLFLDGRAALTHSPERPFVTAVRREKSYVSDRGTVKTSVTEIERVPLTELREEAGRTVFSSGEHSLTMFARPCESGAELLLMYEEESY